MSRSIKRDFQYLSALTIVISMLFLSGFWIFFDYRSLQVESQRVRAKYMLEYEDLLRNQVNRVVTEIQYEQSLTEQKLKRQIKERTEEAWTIAKSLVSQNGITIDDSHLKQLVKDSLRNIRFNNGRGYYFAVNRNGTVELDPMHPETEGRDISSQQSNQGRDIVTDMFEVAQFSGERFYQHTWSSPGRPDREYTRISYVKYLPELNWIIGTGDYLEDFNTELQEYICQRVEQIRFGKEKKDYVFIATWDGISKSFPAKGKNMLETKDANGVYIVKELIEKAKAGGGFVKYVMPTLGGVQSKPKLSYAAPIPEWEWYVGAGVYIDEIDTAISKNQQIFRDNVLQHIKIMLLGLFCLLVIHFSIAHFISRKIWKQIDMFSQFFRRASTESVSMESEILEYRELREISNQTNIMLKERNAILRDVSSSRDEWVNTFNAIGDCIFLVDGSGHVERVNEAAAHMLGIATEKIINRPFSEFCSHDNPVNATLIDKLPHTAEIENEELSRTFLSSSFPLFNTDGELRRIIHIAHDITEQKKLERRLGQAQKMEAIGTLAGGIAHDFNNALSAILGYTELAKHDSPAGSMVAEYLERVMQAGSRAKELVKQILAFNRHTEIAKVPVQVAPIVLETLKLLRSSLPATITVEQDIDYDSGFILADPTQIHQVIMNICTNAYHAMEQTGGTLSVTLKKTSLHSKEPGRESGVESGNFIELIISDNGLGIDPAIQDRIFDPFFTLKETGKGTGMGLAIVHGIVKDCGGFITCDSQLGEGTVFHIKLPVLKEHPRSESHLLEQNVTGSERILFVDDEKMLTDMGQIMLERLGYSVTVSRSGPEALSIFTKQPDAYDLVVTDQTMPGMTGIDLARGILQIRPSFPIILCTGYSSIVSAETARSMGIKGFALKPLTSREIGEIIRKVLEQDDA